MSTVTPGERVHAAVKGDHVDRVPFCFWHHFKPEGSGKRMAELTMEFFIEKFQLDIVKIMPDLPYPAPEHALTGADQVRSLPRLDLTTPMFREQLICIRTLRSQLGDDYPLILTLFSPFTTITRFMGKKAAIEQARKNPDEYGRIVRPYDLQALEGAKAGWLNIVHVHADPDQEGDDLYFEDFVDYPVSVMSWSDRLTGPSLSEASTMTDKCLMAGLWERGPLTRGSEMELDNEITSAVSQTKGRRLILANGCSVPDDVDEQWLHVARRLVDNLS